LFYHSPENLDTCRLSPFVVQLSIWFLPLSLIGNAVGLITLLWIKGSQPGGVHSLREVWQNFRGGKPENVEKTMKNKTI